MYMMYSGKAEISKLSTSMEEMSKVVHELKTELYKRKSAHAATSSEDFSSEKMQLLVNRTNMEDRESSGMKLCGLPIADDAEYPSSILTEEREPGVLEMDQMEAELESELQKLPWSSTAASGHDVTRLNLGKAREIKELDRKQGKKRIEIDGEKGEQPEELDRRTSKNSNSAEVSSEGFCEVECRGVLPSELDNKLCHLLIEQQENQIMGLESELHLAQSQLHEKEAELQALKDRVRSLTEFSLSDDEVEVPSELAFNVEWDKKLQDRI
ncbi:POLAR LOCALIZATION DURING ASYMMETRIC DIVISION AND PROTEIN [Salix koriyanagi]|uniref:POLAR LOCALIZATION DURING ASYMMETRIC DIVISION AND PROTEIN n=1 Tax=Salix koriyanagi TaxID=2511006 RepID=A0A9Q0X599_9ROSI|nr:POLAR LOCALIZATION DURING ASYMMETRIC DIVISION AND PROTEIN [Salix koriyanagi]